MFGIFRDVSAQIEKQQELELERDRFLGVFEEATDAMVISDDNGQYIKANQSAAELFGVSKEELIGRSIDEFAPDDYEFETAWKQFQLSGQERGIFPLVDPDGNERTIEYAATTNVPPGEHLLVLREMKYWENTGEEPTPGIYFSNYSHH